MFRVLVDILESGKSKYALGQVRKLRLIIDRSIPEATSVAYISKISYIDLFYLLRQVCYTFQNNYPEMLHRAYLLPVNAFFSTIYRLFSYLIRPSSRKKINLVQWSPATGCGLLCEDGFTLDTVPESLGGTFRVVH